METMSRAAYVHVPFCHHRCPYCNFTVAVDRHDWIERYLKAIESELSRLSVTTPVDTIFVGGGTPTLLSSRQLSTLFNSISRWLPLSDGGEWTIEANPDDLSNERCQLIAEAGVNRISIGGQSFHDDKLRSLGRQHTGAGLQSAIEVALRYFRHVSLDLIFGAPAESPDVWSSDLQRAIRLGVPHISTYGLTYEKGAAFWAMREKGVIESIPEDLELDMYFSAIDCLTQNGFEHYEVSNFAKDGFACRHNQTYWSLQPWFAFGPGAAGFLNGVRTVNHRSTSRYLSLIESGLSPIAETETIDAEQLTLERCVFGLRRMVGVDLSALELSGHPTSMVKIRSVVASHLQNGWLEQVGPMIRLTRSGLAISDSLWPAFFA